MSSLKEQRERLLQAKMKEMADIGVTKRTAENIPDFDDPIDLDDEWREEDNDTSLSEEEPQGCLSQEGSMITTVSNRADQTLKRKRNGKSKVYPISIDFATYEKRFLTTERNGRSKSGFSIHTEVLQMLRDVVRDLRIETSVTAYIENIILDHLRTYQELLNDTISQRRRDKTIDL